MPKIIGLFNIFLVIVLVLLPPVQSITNGKLNVSISQDGLKDPSNDNFNISKGISYRANLEDLSDEMECNISYVVGPDSDNRSINKTANISYYAIPEGINSQAEEFYFSDQDFGKGNFSKWLAGSNSSNPWRKAWWRITVYPFKYYSIESKNDLGPLLNATTNPNAITKPSILLYAKPFLYLRDEKAYKINGTNLFNYEVQVNSSNQTYISLEVAPSTKGPWTSIAEQLYNNTPGKPQVLHWNNTSLPFGSGNTAYRFVPIKVSKSFAGPPISVPPISRAIFMLLFLGCLVVLLIIYNKINDVTFEYTLVKLSRWYARVRNELPGRDSSRVRSLAFRFVIIVVLVSLIAVSLLPFDPMSLEKKAEGFNKSSSTGSIFNFYLRSEVNYIKEDNISFIQSLTSGPVFSNLLSKPRLFEKALTNLSILDGVLANSTVFASLSNEKTLSNNSAFISIFSAKDVYDKVFGSYVISNETNNALFNGNYSQEKDPQSLKNETLKIAFENTYLRSLCYIEAVNKFPRVKKQIISDLYLNISSRSLAIGAILSDDQMRLSALKDIYKDNETRSDVISIIESDNSLRYQLFKLYHPYLIIFLSLLWSYWPTILGLWLLLELILLFLGSRNGIQIDNFSYDTKFSDPGKKDAYDGLSALLSVRINRLRKLFQDMDEIRSISSVAEMCQPIPAAIKTEDISGFNNKIFTDSSALTLWGLSISGNFFNSLIGWITARPKIVGSLYQEDKDGKKLILTARYASGIRSSSWRVERDLSTDLAIDGSQKQAKLIIDDMINDLAHMIFSELALNNAPWESAKYFAQGLRSYRECIHGTSDRWLKLHESINCFEKCMSKDEDFLWAHYNLGVAYFKMNKKESAKASLEKAIDLHSNYWQPYYALASILFLTKEQDSDKAMQICNEAISYCEKALALEPKDIEKAQISNLIALVREKRCAIKNSQRDAESNADDSNKAKPDADPMPATSQTDKGRTQDRSDNQLKASRSSSKGKQQMDHLISFDDYYEREKSLHTAAVWSLRGLRKAILESDSNKKISAEEVVYKCLEDLALFLLINGKDKNDKNYAEQLLDEALDIFPDNSPPNNRGMHLALAEVCLRKTEPQKALKNIDQGADPCSSRYWTCLDKAANQPYNDPRLACTPALDEVTLYSVLNRFSSTSSDEIKRLIDSLSPTKRDNDLAKALDDLYKIKCYRDRFECDEKWSDELKDWIKAEKALANKDEYQILECISKLNATREKAKGISHRKPMARDDCKEDPSQKAYRALEKHADICNELKYATFLRTLGSLYHFCYLKENYGIIKGSTIISLSRNDQGGCDVRSIKHPGHNPLSRNEDDQCDVRNDEIILKTNDARKEVHDIFRLIIEKVMEISKDIDELPDEYESFKERLLDDWNLSPTEGFDKERIEELAKRYPLNAIHRKNLGRYYLSVYNYPKARDEFNRALLLNPDDPRAIYNIALTYMREAEQNFIADNRAKVLGQKVKNKADYFSKAEEKLSSASDLFDNDIHKIKINYWLGYTNYLDDKYKDAILRLEAAKLISKDVGFVKDEGIIITILLADIYLDTLNYDKCEEELTQLIDNMPENTYNNTIGERLLVKPIKCGYEAAQARLMLAFSYLEREINLDKAAHEISKAYKIIRATDIEKERKSQLMAQYWDCVGWLEYKRYLTELSERESDKIKYKSLKDLELDSVAMVSEITLKDAIITSITNSNIYDSYNIKRRKNGDIEIENVIISSADVSEIVVRTAIGTETIKDIPINKIYMNKALISGRSIIEYDIMDTNNVIKSDFYFYYPNGSKLEELKEIRGIERARIANATLSNLNLGGRIPISGEVPQSLLESAISHLKRSIELQADSQSYLHLATVYATIMEKEKDPVRKAFFNDMAAMACKHAFELDRYRDYANELKALKGRMGRKDEAKKEENKEGTSIILDIQGSAKGEIVPPKGKDKKE